jgi:S-adenosylmethionine-dependent methyltransferase
MGDSDAIRAYYEGYAEHEWERLDRDDDGVLEFTINSRTIAAHLPSGATVLDIGGGPGRYAHWLAARGHRVTLADLSPALLAIARIRNSAGSPLAEIVETDARDLRRWGAGSFDAALALGPFYHLTEAADRERAAAELARVIRPGGLLFAALMPRLAFLRRTIADPTERRHLAAPEFVARIVADGVFVNDEPGRFTGGYGFRPEEIAPFFAAHGFTQLTLLASESAAADLQPQLAELARTDPAAYAATLDMLLSVAAETSILGMASHLLYVGRRAA